MALSLDVGAAGTTRGTLQPRQTLASTSSGCTSFSSGLSRAVAVSGRCRNGCVSIPL